MAHPFLFGSWENIYFIYIYVYVNTYFWSISYASFFLLLKMTQPLCWQFSLDLRSLNGDIKDVICFAKLHIFSCFFSSSVWGFKPCLCFRRLVWRVSSSGERLREDPAPEHCYWWDSLPCRNFCLLWAHSDFLRITEKLSPNRNKSSWAHVPGSSALTRGSVTLLPPRLWQLQSFSEHVPLESHYWVKVTFESYFSSLHLVFSLLFLSHLLRPLLLMTFKSSVHWSPSAPSEQHFYFWEVLDCTFRRWRNPQISYSWLYHSFSSLHLMVEDCQPKLA